MSNSNNTKEKRALERFLHRFDKKGTKSYRRFAYFAALPLILTPELLNYLHAKFLREVPCEAQADLLLSDLCERVGYEMYAMAPALRNYLLREMENSQEADKMEEVAYLLLSYVHQSWRGDSVLSDSELQTQRWGAMAYIADERDQAIEEMDEAFDSSIQHNDKVQMLWLSRLNKTFKPQLEKSKNYPKIVEYAEKVSRMMANSGSDTQKIPLKVFEFEVVNVNKYGEIIKRTPEKASYYTEKLPKGVTMDMVYIPGGTFDMGSPKTEENRFSDEGPQHNVTIPSFFMGKYPITQVQWEAVMGNNPSYFKGKNTKNRSVESISWDDVEKFCEKLSEITGKTYRMPSEAEWEYACRAGTTTPFYFGETITSDLANYNGSYTYANGPKGTYRKKTTDVGSFPPNNFGLYDMHGNVLEWCADPWHENYEGAPTDGSVWDGISGSRVLRGGSWYDYPVVCRTASRVRFTSVFRLQDIGFRVAVAA